MKRLWLIITILSLLCILGLGALFFWIAQMEPGGSATSDDATGRLTQLKSELTRGYHTAAVLRQFKDADPESVLLVIQNEWELRPTGGFMTAFGEGEIVNGGLTNLRIVPSEYFDPQISLKAPMPAGMAYRITTPTLAMRDSNWDVDFATTAATLGRYYQDATGKTPDLVIAITTEAAEHVLAHTGPLDFTVNGHTLSVTSQTVTETLENYTDQSFRELGLEWETRKQILSAFGEALLPRLHAFVKEHPVDTLRLANELLASYDVQLWSAQPSLAQHLASLGAAQTVAATGTTDGLLIVDANVGARKTNRVLQQRADYRVDLGAAQPTATLHITYTHTGTLEPTIIEYYDTVRIYVPQGSTLLTQENLDHVQTYIRHGRTVFEGRLRVPVGSSKTITLSYVLPNRVATTEFAQYRLLLERQPGSANYPVQVTVFDGAQKATIDTDVAHDRTIAVQ
ncbi:MAG: DUF4012 domain-containing protein [Candidatus Andersenbacteria bacterium]